MKFKKTLTALTILLSASNASAQDYVGSLSIDTSTLVWSSSNNYSSGQVVREGTTGDLYLATVGINASDSNLSPNEDTVRWTLLLKGDVNTSDTIKVPESGKAIFVTSATQGAYDVYGLDKADEICQTAADASPHAPNGVYTALRLSKDASPINRTKAYYLLDGTKVVNQGSDLELSRSILHPINLDELLNKVSSNVWTAKDTTRMCYMGPGEEHPYYGGDSSKSNSEWAWHNNSLLYCYDRARLYCAQK
ncbi:hypothetical protein L1077_26280 [Pseudoalteromonas luteoviolacea]|uniref:hypothetical protein n=1 Tax=Pseudoalteromonas luteoviolacea TaxID=43657 RepID=UPI001F3966BF|nr:hypothetical protein [Pseudoalteromonas luteoviolacea]MCF6442935.1 hypothetical protein [Pseudoalteromonas luteoviolacea]